MPHIGIGDRVRQLHLDAEHLPVRALDHQVDLVLPRVGPQVEHLGIACLRRHPDPQRDQGLKQRTDHVDTGVTQQRIRGEREQAGRQRRVGELMLGRLLQAADLIAGQDPARHRVEKPQPREVIAVGDRGRLRRLASIAPRGGVQQS